MHINSAAIDAVGALSAAAGALLEDAEADALAYLDFPAEHGCRIRTNNVRERMNREIKRRSRVVQVLPSPESILKLAEPAELEPAESEASRRRGLMIVETAMELAGTGRRAA